MELFMRKFLSLSFNTARDIIRQPVIAVLTVVCIVTNGIMPVVAVFSLGQEERIVRDGTIASIFVYGLFLVTASSVASISRQIRNGTAGSILVKPVARELFIGATYAGIVMVCLLFVAIGTVAAMLSVRMAYGGLLTDWLVATLYAAAVLAAFAVAGIANYRGRNFYSTLCQALLICLAAALLMAAFIGPGGKFGNYGELIRWRLAPVALLLFGALGMLSAIAVALSTRLAPVIVFACCLGVFVLGLFSDYLVGIAGGAGSVAGVIGAMLPNWQCLLIYENADGSNALTSGYVIMAFGYIALYVSGVLCLGMLAFKNAEV
jgi:hypothetical protein